MCCTHVTNALKTKDFSTHIVMKHSLRDINEILYKPTAACLLLNQTLLKTGKSLLVKAIKN